MQIQTTLWTTTDEEQHGYGGNTVRQHLQRDAVKQVGRAGKFPASRHRSL
jgi:hypothetical protein